MIVFLSAFYALPNLYPNLPVISVDAQKIDTNRIDNLLSEVSFKWIDELTIGFDLIEDQMSALKALQSAGLDDHRFSLNLQSTAPNGSLKLLLL